MSLAELRDLVIIVWGLVGILFLIIALVLIFLIFRRVMGVLHKVNRAVQSMAGVASFATGLRKGFKAWGRLSRLRRKEEDSG